ncbi:MAG: hypothetical protein L3K03_03140 [Thermoplasmata archaeon]|nr:hypothetical protein [Thermoplasmata archaeon]
MASSDGLDRNGNIPLPPPLLRSPRFGPFPSARDGLKFFLIAALGGGVAAVAGALTWLPFLAGGFVVAVYRPDGWSLDERATAWVRWQYCSGEHEPVATPPPGPGSPALKDRAGRWVAALEAEGIPVAFLPPLDRRRLFDGYTGLLRSIDPVAFFQVGSVPRRAAPVLPKPPLPPGPEATAAAGYAEMIRLLLRRRRARRVLVVVGSRSGGHAGLDQLSATLQGVAAGLDAMEIPYRRVSAEEIARRCPGIAEPGPP